MTTPGRRLNRRGIALLMTLLLALLVVSLAIGVLLMMSNTTLITRFHLAEAGMNNLAAGGLEQARDTLNGTPTLVPRPTGHDTLEFNVPLRDASNTIIPGLTRSTYVGLTGSAIGQAGLYASVLSVIRNSAGNTVIRRADFRQQSFAAYERFYNNWSSGSWNSQDKVYGPVHSNRGITLSSFGAPGTSFWSRVTAVNSITNQSTGHFYGGVQTGVSAIPFPTSSTVNSLQPLAAGGGLVVVGDSRTTATDPEVRIDFVAIDLNGDGDTSDEDEGYFRVFRMRAGGGNDDRNYVTGRRWGNSGFWPGVTFSGDPNLRSANCGGQISVAGVPTWLTADSILTRNLPDSVAARNDVRQALSSPQRRCYLGGDRRLFGNLWVTTTPYGSFDSWPGWAGGPPAELVAALAAQGVVPATDPTAVALTFWPLSRVQNTGARGVVFVTGSVAVSGRLRGQVTLAAQGNIMLADDLNYAQAPNTTCADILGLVSRESILLEDNSVNSPFRVDGNWTTMFDDTPDEFINAFMLGLNVVGGENLGAGESPAGPEDCGGIGTTSRGCRFLVGGIAQGNNNLSWNGSTGWRDQDTYDQCGSVSPPPYYPTTGQFSPYRYYEIDPVGFNPVAWFAANQ